MLGKALFSNSRADAKLNECIGDSWLISIQKKFYTKMGPNLMMSLITRLFVCMHTYGLRSNYFLLKPMKMFNQDY